MKDVEFNLKLIDSQLQNPKNYSNGNDCNRSSVIAKKTHEDDHTVLSGVVINWGHGWGWGQDAWTTQAACAHDSAVSTALYCHAAEDYGVSGYEEVDWSAFGDFCF
ncbi:hypothetical protein FQA39_LY16570 [Lamprigera yunnana]|nr:hypothetical protein FQA39_LY16570 [Lamprigera yunnana]